MLDVFQDCFVHDLFLKLDTARFTWENIIAHLDGGEPLFSSTYVCPKVTGHIRRLLKPDPNLQKLNGAGTICPRAIPFYHHVHCVLLPWRMQCVRRTAAVQRCAGKDISKGWRHRADKERAFFDVLQLLTR